MEPSFCGRAAGGSAVGSCDCAVGRWTRPLDKVVSALDLETALEDDLGTGDVVVTRTAEDALNRVHWNVTFAGAGASNNHAMSLPSSKRSTARRSPPRRAVAWTMPPSRATSSASRCRPSS